MATIYAWAGLWIGSSFLMGWSPGHLVRPYTHVTAVAMLVGAILAAATCETRRQRWVCAGLLMLLPGLWATNEAYHLLLGVPLLIEGMDELVTK